MMMDDIRSLQAVSATKKMTTDANYEDGGINEGSSAEASFARRVAPCADSGRCRLCARPCAGSFTQSVLCTRR